MCVEQIGVLKIVARARCCSYTTISVHEKELMGSINQLQLIYVLSPFKYLCLSVLSLCAKGITPQSYSNCFLSAMLLT